MREAAGFPVVVATRLVPRVRRGAAAIAAFYGIQTTAAIAAAPGGNERGFGCTYNGCV
jgi:hypothetical protein